MEEQYLPTVPFSVHSIEMFYNLAAKTARAMLKLPIRGYVQAKSASRRQWRKLKGAAAALERGKLQGRILLHEMYIFDSQDSGED